MQHFIDNKKDSVDSSIGPQHWSAGGPLTLCRIKRSSDEDKTQKHSKHWSANLRHPDCDGFDSPMIRVKLQQAMSTGA